MTIKKRILDLINILCIFGGAIISERMKSGAPWMDIVYSERWHILLVAVIIIIIAIIAKDISKK